MFQTDDIRYQIFIIPHLIDVRNIKLFVQFELSSIRGYTQWVV
jgi:hypothetical protein